MGKLAIWNLLFQVFLKEGPWPVVVYLIHCNNLENKIVYFADETTLFANISESCDRIAATSSFLV